MGLLLLLWLCGYVESGLPAGFSDTLHANVDYPTDLAFLPDGTMLVLSLTGKVVPVQDGTVLPPAIVFDGVSAPNVCQYLERGMLGMVLHPNFTTNNLVYFYFTTGPGCDVCAQVIVCNETLVHNHLVRYKYNMLTKKFDLNSMELLFRAPSGPYHNSGKILFGKDGYLYLSVGDGAIELDDPTGNHKDGTNGNARRLDILYGKILRLHDDGSPVEDNPWFNANDSRRCGDLAGTPPGTGPCQEAFATGVRNTFRFAIDPNTPGTQLRLFGTDVGQDTWEEVNDIRAGHDYGWNLREGRCLVGSLTDCPPTPEGLTDPLWSYDHYTTGGCAVAGAFIPYDSGWPEEYLGQFIWGDYVSSRLFLMHFDEEEDGSAVNASVVWWYEGWSTVSLSVVAVIPGPTPEELGLSSTFSVYFLVFPNSIRRIDYTILGNFPPVPSVQADPPSAVEAPLNVTFNASLTYDPNGDEITYNWNFGDPSSPNNTALDAGSVVEHTYWNLGQYVVQLTASDVYNAQSSLEVVVVVGVAPQVTVIEPADDVQVLSFAVVHLNGSAMDSDGQALVGANVWWTAVLHHIPANAPKNAHTHPLLPVTTGGTAELVFPEPEGYYATQFGYVEAILSARDSNGITTSASIRLEPFRRVVHIMSEPADLPVVFTVVGVAQPVGPLNITWWAGSTFVVSAPPTISLENSEGSYVWSFANWSDGGSLEHAVVPDGDYSELVANYSLTYFLANMTDSGGVHACETFTVTSQIETYHYTVNGTGGSPTLILTVGCTYLFIINVDPIHPLALTENKNSVVIVTEGVVGAQNIYQGSFTYTPTAPRTLAYQCMIHNFAGDIIVLDPDDVSGGGDTGDTGNGTYTDTGMDTGNGLGTGTGLSRSSACVARQSFMVLLVLLHVFLIVQYFS